MAAGVELDTAQIDDFRRGLSASVRQQQAGLHQTPTLQIDSYVTLGELSLPFTRDVARIAPFGAGNPPLVLASTGLTITGSKQLGRDAKHFKLTVEDDAGTSRQVVWWNADALPAGRFDLAYTVRENTFRGEREVLIEWLDYRQQERDVIEVAGAKRENITFIDHRNAPDTLKVAQSILADEGDNLLVWAEVVTFKDVPSGTRLELTPAAALLVLATPPDAATWGAVLDAVRPERVYLVGADANMDDPQAFLQRLAGLVRYALRAKAGEVSLDELAAVTTQTREAVRAGLDWFSANGQLTFVERDGKIAISEGGSRSNPKDASNRLMKLLGESLAYRSYWRRATIDSLRG